MTKSTLWSTLVCVLLVLSLLSNSYAGYVPPGPRYECPKETLLTRFLYPCNCTAGSDAGLYVNCENTNLASLSVGLANLASINYPLEQLTFTSCNFVTFYGDLLYPLKVRILRIVNTPIRSIQPFTFLGVNRTLQEIHIINSELQEFPNEAFSILGNLTILNIDGHKITKLHKNSFSSTIMPDHLQRLSIINGPLAHLPTETLTACKRLKRLDLHNNSLSALTRGQFKGLRDVEFLDLSFNNLSKVDGSHMSDLTKMGWCNLSNNALSELTRGTFARNAVLRSLSLSYNKLKKLDSNSFRGMRLIRRLYLSDNLIVDVGRGTFDSLGRIGTIDLARNLLRKIDYQMFNRLQYVEIGVKWPRPISWDSEDLAELWFYNHSNVIDVSSNLVTEIQKHAFKELYLVHINLSYNQIEKIEPHAFESCANITVLDMSFNRISNIPRNAFDEITYATELQLSNNFLSDLSELYDYIEEHHLLDPAQYGFSRNRSAVMAVESLVKVPLANMTGIKVLNVSHNQIEVIPRNTFPKLYELHTIDMSFNNITDIAVAVFQPLFSLRTLLFSFNMLEEIKSGTFGTLPTLLHLDLSHNLLSQINKQAFTRLASLRTMTLEDNRLTELFDISQSLSHLDASYNYIDFEKPHKWPPMNALLSLNLSHNMIGDNLLSDSLSPLLTLQSMDLSYNGITIPPKEALSTLPSLRELNLMNNNIKELDKQCFGTLPIMSRLNLAFNQIEALRDYAFFGLTQLTELNLSGNLIVNITSYAFKDLVALRSLDLSQNKLESLDNKTNSIFEELLSLEKLNLRSNKISFVTRKSFPSNQWVNYRLHHLDLSYNEMPVITYELTFGTKTLHYLNISYNMITEIRKSVLGNLTSLKVLDLSHNMIDDLTSPHVFVLPKDLTYLSLAHNSLHTFPVKPIQEASALRHLDLRYNQLELFYNNLLPKIINGTQIYYEGNPLFCDCTLRPVRRWALSLQEPDEAWTQFLCQDPPETANTSIVDLSEVLLSCNSTEESENTEDYQLTPDVKFRAVRKLKDQGIRATWFVNTKTDVADFKLFVREQNCSTDSSDQSLWDKREPYNTRSDTFYYLPKNRAGLELCVEAITSGGLEKSLIPSQCHPLPYLNTGTSNLSNRFLSLILVYTLVCAFYL